MGGSNRSLCLYLCQCLECCCMLFILYLIRWNMDMLFIHSKEMLFIKFLKINFMISNGVLVQNHFLLMNKNHKFVQILKNMQLNTRKKMMDNGVLLLMQNTKNNNAYYKSIMIV